MAPKSPTPASLPEPLFFCVGVFPSGFPSGFAFGLSSISQFGCCRSVFNPYQFEPKPVQGAIDLSTDSQFQISLVNCFLERNTGLKEFLDSRECWPNPLLSARQCVSFSSKLARRPMIAFFCDLPADVCNTPLHLPGEQRRGEPREE